MHSVEEVERQWQQLLRFVSSIGEKAGTSKHLRPDTQRRNTTGD